MRKFIVRFVLYTFIALFSLLALSATLVYVYQDKLIGLFVEEANKKLRTPVAVSKIELTFWDTFPRVALTFHDISVTESIKGSQTPLLKAKKLYFTFGLLKLINGEYEINRVVAEEGEINIRKDADGNPNYLILAPDTTTITTQSKPINFHLKQIKLDAMLLRYSPDSSQTFDLLARELKASLHLDSAAVRTTLDGKLLVNRIRNGQEIFFQEKNINFITELIFDKVQNQLTIQPTDIQIEKMQFGVRGTIVTAPQALLDLSFEGKNTTIPSLLSLLPKSLYQKVSAYQSEGEIYFEGTAKGEASKQKQPAVTLDFGCKNVAFYHPDFKKRIEKVGFKGHFSNAGEGSFTMRELRGSLDDKLFEANVAVRNFKDPFLELDFSGDFDIESLLQLFPQQAIEYARGHLDLTLDFKGRLADLKSVSTVSNTQTDGELSIQGLDFKLKNKAYEFMGLEGNFIFNKNDIAVSGFQGRAGGSDFALDGYFKNSIAFFLFPNADLRLDASFKSRNLDLDELLSASGEATENKGHTSQEEPYKFVISPKLALRLQCDIDNLAFRQFHPKKITGLFTLAAQQANAETFSMQLAGGKIGLTGTLNAQKQDDMLADLRIQFQKIDADSVFYLFEDFNQKFLTHKQIRGKLTTDTRAKVYFNEKLDIDTRRLWVEAATSIVNGQLNNFEPMQQLSKFIDRNELSNLRFAELKNTFRVENQTLYIPEMDIKSNVFSVSVMGTQTFDKKMDYKLKVPLNNFARPDRDAAFGAVREEGGGKTSVMLTVKGTTDNFKIAYDKQAVKEKIKQSWQKEKEEFKSLFRKQDKEKEEKKPEPAKKPAKKPTEYFDF